MNVKATWILLIAAVLLIPTLWSQANPDANGDGCIDLADYAAMQSTMTGPSCTPHQVRSFHAEGNESFELVDMVPGAQGFIVTDMTANLPDEVRQRVVEALAVNRLGTVEDVAEAVAYVSSDAAGYLTGQTICVDGGLTMC